jgi:hypothetical protein
MKVSDIGGEEYGFQQLSELFQMWRGYDAIAASFSVIGLVLSTIEYEINYSEHRTYKNCDEYRVVGDWLRYGTTLTTLMALLFVLLRYYYKDKWIGVLYRIQQESMMGTVWRKAEQRRNFEIILESFFLCIFPYPELRRILYIPIRHDFKTVLTCYTWSEILYSFMFLRLFHILRAISNYTRYQDYVARLVCGKYNLKPNALFSFKCLLATYPFYVISLMFFFLLVFSSIVFRVFERPLQDFQKEYFSNPLTSLWFVLETASTLGYGDLYPFSYPGRTISVIIYLLGAIIFTIIIVTLQKVTALSYDEDQAFQHILKSKNAAAVIRAGIRYFLVKKDFSTGSAYNLKMYFDLLKEVKAFKICKERIRTAENDLGSNVRRLKNEIGRTKKMVEAAKFELARVRKHIERNYKRTSY